MIPFCLIIWNLILNCYPVSQLIPKCRHSRKQVIISLNYRKTCTLNVFFLLVTLQCRIQVGGERNRRTPPPPPKIGSTLFFVMIQFLIKMLKNKAQIARESIKRTPELPGPLSGPWTPAKSEFGSALVICVLAHNLLRPPPHPKWKSWIRPCSCPTLRSVKS